MNWAAPRKASSRAIPTGAPYRYEETTWADDMEWGAAELFRATRERRYLDDAKHYARLAAAESWMGKEQTGHYQFYPFMNAGHFRLYDLVDRQFKKLLAGYYREGIERCVRGGRERTPIASACRSSGARTISSSRWSRNACFYERMTGDRALSRLRRPAARLAAGPQSVGLHDVHGGRQRLSRRTRT